MAKPGTFVGELQRGWRRLIDLSWRGKALAALVLIGSAATIVLTVYVASWAQGGRPTKHVSYQSLLDGNPSPTLAVRMEDNSIDFRLRRISETTDGNSKRLIVSIDVRRRSNYKPELTCRLAYTDAGADFSANATRFTVSGTPVEHVDLDEKTLEIEAEFLVPETARPISLELNLFLGGLVPLLPGQHEGGLFVFDP
jgi:hypothetical protein